MYILLHHRNWNGQEAFYDILPRVFQAIEDRVLPGHLACGILNVIINNCVNCVRSASIK